MTGEYYNFDRKAVGNKILMIRMAKNGSKYLSVSIDKLDQVSINNKNKFERFKRRSD